jgi:hypothetical protein
LSFGNLLSGTNSILGVTLMNTGNSVVSQRLGFQLP